MSRRVRGTTAITLDINASLEDLHGDHGNCSVDCVGNLNRLLKLFDCTVSHEVSIDYILLVETDRSNFGLTTENTGVWSKSGVRFEDDGGSECSTGTTSDTDASFTCCCSLSLDLELVDLVAVAAPPWMLTGLKV